MNVPIFLLAAVRGGEQEGREPVNRIPLSAASGPVILTLELATIDYPSYRASLRTGDGKEVWQARGLRPDSRDTLVLLLPSRMLRPGSCRLGIEGTRDDGKGFAVAAYPFQVVRRGSGRRRAPSLWELPSVAGSLPWSNGSFRVAKRMI